MIESGPATSKPNYTILYQQLCMHWYILYYQRHGTGTINEQSQIVSEGVYTTDHLSMHDLEKGVRVSYNSHCYY